MKEKYFDHDEKESKNRSRIWRTHMNCIHEAKHVKKHSESSKYYSDCRTIFCLNEQVWFNYMDFRMV